MGKICQYLATAAYARVKIKCSTFDKNGEGNLGEADQRDYSCYSTKAYQVYLTLSLSFHFKHFSKLKSLQEKKKRYSLVILYSNILQCN